MSSRKRRGRHEEEEHEEGSERWLVSYADMVTVLMILFIVMFAMSTVDSQKYQQLRAGLASGFGNSISVLGGTSEAAAPSAGLDPVSGSSPILSNLNAAQQDEVQQALAATNAQQAGRANAEAQAEIDHLEAIWRRVDKALAKAGLQSDVQALIDSRGLVISLVSRHVIFEANLATLAPRGQRILSTMAPVLADLTEPIQLDGHTNQAPGKPKYFETDWDLSTARSIASLRYLNEQHTIAADRLSATGFGHTKPLIDPKIVGSQEINKRVDIVVQSQVPAEVRARFDQVNNPLKADAFAQVGGKP